MIFEFLAICLVNPTDAAKRDDVRIEIVTKSIYKSGAECEEAMERFIRGAAACELSCISKVKK